MDMNLSYDIAADLETPVSAFLKLRPFRPRFLLESVEQGLRIARYSYIGFGDCTEFRLDRDGLHIDGSAAVPAMARRCSTRCETRRLLAAARAGATASAARRRARRLPSYDLAPRSIRHRDGRVRQRHPSLLPVAALAALFDT